MKSKRQGDNRRGAALVEMALVLPVFLSIVLGIVEFGRAMMASQLITSGARLGARQSIMDSSSNAAISQSVKDFCTTSLGISAVDVQVTISVVAAPGNTDAGGEVANAQSGDLCTVAVAIPFSKVTLITPKFLADNNLVGSCTLPHE